MSSAHVYVLSALGRRFGIRLDAGTWDGDSARGRGYVVDDLDAEVELAEVGASCTPFLVQIEGEPHIMFAGTGDVGEQRYVAIDDHPYPVHAGVWMSFPERFAPGRVVKVAGLDEQQRELFRLTSAPLDTDSLPPLFGPAWTAY